MKSERRLLTEEVRQRLDPRERQVDLSVQLWVHVKGPRGQHHPPVPRALLPSQRGTYSCPVGWGCHVLEQKYGGRWDRVLRRYIATDIPSALVSTHPGALPGLLFNESGVNDVLFLGAPRGGKTLNLIVGALLDSLRIPAAQGGLVAPTNPRLVILWDDAMRLLGPLGWERHRLVDREIYLPNESVWKFVSALPASRSLGPPVQGFTWAWAKVDERQNVSEESYAEILLRGASYGDRYCVKGAATNQDIAPFQRALDEYRSNETKRLFQVPGRQNSFISDATWEAFRKSGNWSEEDYNRIINAEVIKAEGLIYKSFDGIENVPRDLRLGRDVTAELTLERTGEQGYPWIVGHDFGWVTNASVFLKAYATDLGGRIWVPWAELITRNLTAAEHAQALLDLAQRRFSVGPESLYVVADPHVNKPDTDDSDYAQFRRARLKIVKARNGNIDVKHRFSMVNALCCDSAGRRSLYIARDANGVPTCPKLIESFKSYCYNIGGKPEQYGKDSRKDPSHVTDALGYGVYYWEKIRGSHSFEPLNQEGSGGMRSPSMRGVRSWALSS